jgi:hypothetical protein
MSLPGAGLVGVPAVTNAGWDESRRNRFLPFSRRSRLVNSRGSAPFRMDRPVRNPGFWDLGFFHFLVVSQDCVETGFFRLLVVRGSSILVVLQRFARIGRTETGFSSSI